jgi:uncharacterized protein
MKGHHMPNIFRDPIERRPRALWRLLIQALIFFLLIFLLQMVIVLLGTVLLQPTIGVDFTAALMSLQSNPIVLILLYINQLVAVSISLLIAARWLDRRPLRDFGFHFSPRWWRDLGFGLILGAVLMTVIFAFELGVGWIEITGYTQPGPDGQPFWIGILMMLVVFISVGIYEEMLFRGYQLRNLAEGFEGRFLNPRFALLLAYFLSSIAFGAAHAFNPNATFISSFNIAMAGLFLGLGFVLTGELAMPIGLHITWNFFQGNVFGFPVSGMQFGATFIQINQTGPELLTGGAFGPEAGLIGLTAMLLGSLLTVIWVRYHYGTADLRQELAVYTRNIESQSQVVKPEPRS